MKLTQKMFKYINTIALFAIVFASLAPSISHALAAQQGTNSFAQEICTSDGQTVTIQVVTSQGQQLATSLDTVETKSPVPTDMVLHLNHCPFCSNPSVSTALAPSQALVIAVLEAKAEQVEVLTAVQLPRFSVLPPPAQAPPQL